MWGQTSIHVVIVPSFLAISFLGQSINSHFISRLQFQVITGPLATWIVESFAERIVQGQVIEYSWGIQIIIASFTLSIAVNTLVTGLIVFKILRVFLEVKAATTSVERTLGKTWAGTTLRHVIFVIIESGMAFLVVQLAHLMFYILEPEGHAAADKGYIMSTGINQMFNVISIRPVHLLLLFLLITFF